METYYLAWPRLLMFNRQVTTYNPFVAEGPLFGIRCTYA